MISFTELNEQTRAEIEATLTDNTAPSEAEYISEILNSFYELASEEFDTGVGICLSDGCILVRIFDTGRYTFVYPIPVSDECDVRAATEAVRAYAVKEELPLVFSDVPCSELGTLAAFFRHVTLDASDPECELYRAEIMSECMLASKVPCVADGDLELSCVSEDDISEMARLYTSQEVNRYWGYDFREDTDTVQGSYFYDTAVTELAMGTAMTMSARLDGRYVGEAVLHAFDFRGSAEVAIRLLPEWQGKGLGRRLLELSFDAAREIGLVRVRASVMRDNVRSVAMLSKYMDHTDVCDAGCSSDGGSADWIPVSTSPSDICAEDSDISSGGEILHFVKELY